MKKMIWYFIWMFVYPFPAMTTSARHSRFTNEEAAPLLLALSELHRVIVVEDGPYLHVDWPHICWLDQPELHVSDTLAQYPGAGLWLLLIDFPRACIAVQPDTWKQEPQIVESKELGEFRARMVAEIPKLADYLQEQLELRNKTPMGVEMSKESLELPFIEDRDGPGGGVLLAADPKKFAATRVATSPFDRATHFWITPDEIEQLGSAVAKAEGSNRYLLLKRVADSSYGALFIPDEIPRLADECNAFLAEPGSRALRDALMRLQSICRSAQHYHLGIYVAGK